jgi:uncharacterized RDD family membrane protein YckC
MQLVSLWDDVRTQLPIPEQVDLQLEMANVGSRGLAIMLDFAIRYGAVILLYFGLIVTEGLNMDSLDYTLQGYVIFLILFAFVAEWFYFTIFEWWWNGQTPGKRALGLRVIKVDGSPVGPIEVLLRNFLRPIDTTGPMALVGIASIFIAAKAQRPGDWVARTMVVRDRPVDWTLFETGGGDTREERTPASRAGSLPLGPLDVELLHRYFAAARRIDSAAVRDRLASAVRGAVERRLGPIDLGPKANTDESWLREVNARI